MSEKFNEADDELPPELEQKLSELEILRQSVEQAQTKEKEVFDQLLRLTAEFQNFRKRAEARVVDARKAGKEDVLLQIISLSDALIHAEISTRDTKDSDGMKKGLAMVLSQFEKFLSDQGLVPIKAKGEMLDPSKHEAIARVPSEELEEGTIVDEIQRGYMLNGQIVRPSRVSVAAKPSETVKPVKATE